MSRQDKLPVLAFPAPPRAPDRPAPRPADPDDLARALAALRAAEAREETRRERATQQPQQGRATESFSPVGTPRPVWRAGARGDAPDGAPPAPGGARMLALPGTGPALDRDGTARRIVSLWLPDLSMERWHRWASRAGEAPPEDVPVALAAEGPHGPVVHACNRAATQEGITAGARIVDMRALCPSLQVVYAEIAGDRILLQKLMLWMRRWCPWTAVDGADGLVLDTTGSDHLWGGEPAMLRDMEEKLSHLGLSAHLALAPTHGAAWALARFGAVREVIHPARLAARVAPLPVRALRIDGDTVLLLQRLGLKSVGDLAAVPRISLARRFSRAELPRNPLMRLDQLMGRLPEPVSAPDDPPRFAVQARLPEPIEDPTPHLPSLCDELCAGLAAAGFGARRVTVTVYRTDGEVRQVTVATARASREAAHLARLFEGKLEAIDPGYGFDLITLSASVAEALAPNQTRLDGRIDEDAELARLVDRLTARLGANALRTPAPRDSHIPERAETWQPAMAGPPVPPALRAHRPLRLFDHPEEVRVLYAVPEGPPAQFVWRRLTHRVSRFAGPERIAPEWWCDLPGTRLRDYYRVEDHRGRRFWLYRDGVMGDGRGETPRWFVHGVFA